MPNELYTVYDRATGKEIYKTSRPKGEPPIIPEEHAAFKGVIRKDELIVDGIVVKNLNYAPSRMELKIAQIKGNLTEAPK